MKETLVPHYTFKSPGRKVLGLFVGQACAIFQGIIFVSIFWHLVIKEGNLSKTGCQKGIFFYSESLAGKILEPGKKYFSRWAHTRNNEGQVFSSPGLTMTEKLKVKHYVEHPRICIVTLQPEFSDNCPSFAGS